MTFILPVCSRRFDREHTGKSYQLPLDSHSHRPSVNAYHVPTRFQAAKLQAGEAPIYLDMV